MQSALNPGEAVILTSGIYGSLKEVEGDALLVEVADGVTIKVARGAIASVVRQEPVPDEPEES